MTYNKAWFRIEREVRKQCPKCGLRGKHECLPPMWLVALSRKPAQEADKLPRSTVK